MITFIINPEYEQYASFIRSIPQIFNQEGETIYKDRNEIKVFDRNGEKINVKQYKVPFILNRIVYTFFRKTKAYRAYVNALKLLAEDIESPAPIACIIIRKTGLIRQCYFVSVQSPYTRNMYEFGEGVLEGREVIIRRLAQYTAKLHEAGVYHNDFSPGNILFEQTSVGVRFSLIDINRMQFGAVSIKKGCANFARLWGSDEMFRLIAEEYAAARHAEASACIRWVFFYKRRFWRKYARRHEMPFNL